MLSKENIENNKFIKRNKNTWIGWKDYICEIENPEYEYYNKVTLHYPVMGNQYKILVHRYLNEDNNIEKQIEEGESEIVYKGLIEDENELIIILKLLGINVK